MAVIAPFRALRYSPEKVGNVARVIAPPYDVISPEEQERLYAKSPYNVVRLILSRDADPYRSAACLLARWQQEGVLVRDPSARLYFLRHRFRLPDGTPKERRGFFALAQLEDPSSGEIRAHEKTLRAPREDRLRLLLACHAHLSAVFALYSDPERAVVNALEERFKANPPELEAEAESGEHYRLWATDDRELIAFVQREMRERKLLIADGHHRYEAALGYRDLMRAERGGDRGEGFNFVLMYFNEVADEGLLILPTHRLLKRLDLPPQTAEKELAKYFYIERYAKTAPGRRAFLGALKRGRKNQRRLGVSFRGHAHYLLLRLRQRRILRRLAADMSPCLRELDVSILHRLVLEHALGVRIEGLNEGTIAYCEDGGRALDSVESGECDAAFLVNPPGCEEVLEVALSGETMPQKSTFFYPKLPCGLVLNRIDEPVPALEV